MSDTWPNRPLPVVSVTKRTTFCAAHYYWQSDWSEAENRERFHACSNRYGHGHNYELFVTVKGAIDPETSMVVNLSELKGVLNQVIVDALDHRHLNEQIPFFASGVIPTLEMLAYYSWLALQSALKDRPYQLSHIRLLENESLWVTMDEKSSIPDWVVSRYQKTKDLPIKLFHSQSSYAT